MAKKVVLAKPCFIKQYLNKTDTYSLSANSSKLQLHTPENTNIVVFINIVPSKKYWEESIIAKIFRLWHANVKI